MAESQDFASAEDSEPEVVKFDYIKSSLFRVIHAEGIWGCVTPSFGIQVAFWNERFPIPQQVSYGRNNEGFLEEIKDQRIIRDSIVREVEASIVINLDTAEMLVEWLQERIEEIYELMVVEKEQTKEDTSHEL